MNEGETQLQPETEKRYQAGQDNLQIFGLDINACLLYTSPSPRDRTRSRMPSSA